MKTVFKIVINIFSILFTLLLILVAHITLSILNFDFLLFADIGTEYGTGFMFFNNPYAHMFLKTIIKKVLKYLAILLFKFLTGIDLNI